MKSPWVRQQVSARALLAASLLWVAPAAALTLPRPSGDPTTIDFAADPVLRFARETGPAAPLLDRIGRAVAAHPAVAGAREAVLQAQGVRVQARAGLFPQADLSLVAGRQLARDFGSRQTIVESLQPRGRTDAVVSGEQLLFDWGASSRRIAAADDRTAAARAEVEATASETALSAVAAWYDVLAAETLSDLAAAAAARNREILMAVRERVAHDVAPASDIARVEAMQAEADTAATRAARQLAVARAAYRELFSEAPAGPSLRALPPATAAVSSDAAAMLARRAPGVLAARRYAAAAGRDLAAVRADGRPRLSAGIVGTRYDVFGGSDYEVRGQLALRQSLSAGGRQRGLVEEASARARAADFDADRIAGLAERDAVTAFATAGATDASVASLGAAYTAQRRVRDAYAEQFRVARGSLIELLRAEGDYQASAAALVQAACDADVAHFALLARTGELLPRLGLDIAAN